MTTHDRLSKSPKRRPMVGSAVAMMVWFSAARNAVSISPKKMVRTSAWVMVAWAMAPAGGAGLIVA